MRKVSEEELLNLLRFGGEQVFCEIDYEEQDGQEFGCPSDEWLVLVGAGVEAGTDVFKYNVLSSCGISLEKHGDLVSAHDELMEGKDVSLDFNDVIVDTQIRHPGVNQYIVMSDNEIQAMINRLQAVLDSRPKDVIERKDDYYPPEPIVASGTNGEPTSEWVRWFRGLTGCSLEEAMAAGVQRMDELKRNKGNVPTLL